MHEQLRVLAFAVLVFGVALTLVSIFADPLALGMPHSGFGWKQILGTVVGIAISGLGFWLVSRFEE